MLIVCRETYWIPTRMGSKNNNEQVHLQQQSVPGRAAALLCTEQIGLHSNTPTYTHSASTTTAGTPQVRIGKQQNKERGNMSTKRRQERKEQR